MTEGSHPSQMFRPKLEGASAIVSGAVAGFGGAALVVAGLVVWGAFPLAILGAIAVLAAVVQLVCAARLLVGSRPSQALLLASAVVGFGALGWTAFQFGGRWILLIGADAVAVVLVVALGPYVRR